VGPLLPTLSVLRKNNKGEMMSTDTRFLWRSCSMTKRFHRHQQSMNSYAKLYKMIYFICKKINAYILNRSNVDIKFHNNASLCIFGRPLGQDFIVRFAHIFNIEIMQWPESIKMEVTINFWHTHVHAHTRVGVIVIVINCNRLHDLH